jgi:hypothetical protein
MFTKSNETETTKNSNETEPTEATFYLFFQEIFRASFFTRFNRSNTTVRCVRETRQTTLLE